MKPILLASTLAAPFAFAGMAAAQDTPTISAAIAQLEEAGYRIRDLDVENANLEIDAAAPDGSRVELIVETATGTILSEQPDD